MAEVLAGVKRGLWYARLYWPVMITGKVALELVAYLFWLTMFLIQSLSEGGAQSSVIKNVMVIPVMFLASICLAEIVPSLRADGSLELLATLAKPHLFLLHRTAPLAAMVVAQQLLIAPLMGFSMGPLQALGGLLAAVIPLAYAASVAFYWNLRLKGAGAVLVASILSNIPAVIWITNAHLFPDETTVMIPAHKVWLSSARCQLGLLMAAAVVGALAWRRLRLPEKLLNEQ